MLRELSPYWSIEEDEYGIGGTPFFYCIAMVMGQTVVDMLLKKVVLPQFS